MNEIYWITRLDSIKSLTFAVLIFSIFALMAGLILYGSKKDYMYGLLKNGYTEESPNVKQQEFWSKKSIHIISVSAIFLFMSILSQIFVPNTKEAFLIYGIGTTVDYLKTNEKVTNLPDKCIDALDSWIESLDKNDENKTK